MKYIVAISVALLGTSTGNVFAAIPNLNCVVQKPCAQSSSHSLGFCITKHFLIHSLQGKMAAVIMRPKSNSIGNDGVIVKVIPVQVIEKNERQRIRGSIEQGETWIDLILNNDTTYSGDLVLEEDFAFTASCHRASRL